MKPSLARSVKRRRSLLSPALCCGLALFAGWSLAQEPAQPAPAPGPRLVVETNVIDLGQVVHGESAEARFALRNEGSEVLRILRAKPG